VLYWDSSALIKRYVREVGTEIIESKLQEQEVASQPAFTSVITFAEIHTALARRAKDNSLSQSEFVHSGNNFDSDWAFGLTVIALEAGVLNIVRDVVRLGLRSADAMHLASAIWVRDFINLYPTAETRGASVLFLTADEKLADAAKEKRLQVFNPLTPQ
jgi:predicted nucleic acid-binding protein